MTEKRVTGYHNIKERNISDVNAEVEHLIKGGIWQPIGGIQIVNPTSPDEPTYYIQTMFRYEQ